MLLLRVRCRRRRRGILRAAHPPRAFTDIGRRMAMAVAATVVAATAVDGWAARPAVSWWALN